MVARAACPRKRTVAGHPEGGATGTVKGVAEDVEANFNGETAITTINLRRRSGMMTWCVFPFVGAGLAFVRRPETPVTSSTGRSRE